MNKIMIIGNLTKDVYSATTLGGKQYAKLSVAVNRTFGEQKMTDFFDVMAWNTLAENCAKYLAKGDKAEVTTFSFLMSAPIIVGACAARFSGGAAVSPLPLLAGFLSAALFGFLAIRLFARFVRANNFLPFRIYLIVAAVASIAL